MLIPKNFLNLDMTCNECGYQNTPDIITNHLIEEHFYTISEAEHAMKEWIHDFPQDEDANPLDECRFHGWYPYNKDCGSCLKEERYFNQKIA